MVDPGVVCLFASGAAHRGGALSRIQPLWLPPITTRGNPHLSINSFIRTPFPIHPVPETDYLHRCSSLTALFILPHPCSVRSLVLAMQTFLSVFPVFDFLLLTWTVYPFLKELCLPILTLPALLICSVICLPPALISSLNSVYDSVLPTWYLTPGIDLCLYDLSCEVIKLHMDLNDTASTLQVYFIDTN